MIHKKTIFGTRVKKPSWWLLHAMNQGKNTYTLRQILRLGKIYNRLDFWNSILYDYESDKMERIRELIEKYSLTHTS